MTHPSDGERLLALLAKINGQLVWESLSETRRHNLTVNRRADMLAAYREWCAFRDGRETFTDAWNGVATIANRYGVSVLQEG